MIQTTLDFETLEQFLTASVSKKKETEEEEDARWDRIFAKKIDPHYYSGAQVRYASTSAAMVEAAQERSQRLRNNN